MKTPFNSRVIAFIIVLALTVFAMCACKNKATSPNDEGVADNGTQNKVAGGSQDDSGTKDEVAGGSQDDSGTKDEGATDGDGELDDDTTQEENPEAPDIEDEDKEMNLL